MAARRTLAVFSGAVLCTVVCPVRAWHLDYSLQLALGYSDNVNQSQLDPTGQTLLIPRLNFDFSEEGTDLRARAVGQVEYRDYVQGAFDNEFRGQLSALATWVLSPRRFSLDFEDYASVQPVNVFATNAPGNTQQTNVFTFGPTFQFRVAQTLNGQAELRLTNSLASESKEFDSNRAMAALRLIKDLSPLTQISLSGEVQHVHFTDVAGGPDYDRGDVFARWQSKLSPSFDIDLAGGWTRLEFSDNEPNRSSPLARGTLTWRATPSQTLNVNFLRQYADASQDLIIDPTAFVNSALGSGLPGGNGVVVGSQPITSDVYLEKRVGAGWAWQSERWRLHADPYWRKLDYVFDPVFDQTAHGANAGVSYRMRPLWTVGFDAAEETRRYASLDRRDEDLRLDLSFLDQLTRQWSLRLDLIRNERNSTVFDESFKENVFFVTMIYRR